MNVLTFPCSMEESAEIEYCFKIYEGAAWLSRVQRGSVRVHHGSVGVQRGSVRVKHGSVQVQRGSVRVQSDSVRVQRGSVGSALACYKAGPRSNLSSAPHGGSAH